MKNRNGSTETRLGQQATPAQRVAALKLARGESTTGEEQALAMDFLRACGATTVRGARR